MNSEENRVNAFRDEAACGEMLNLRGLVTRYSSRFRGRS